MKKVTISMDEEVARWARVEAAHREMSLSRFVGEILREHMQEAQAYDRPMRDFLATEPTGSSNRLPYPRRDELYDRPAFRR